MNFTPLNLDALKTRHKDFIRGPLIVFMLIIVVAVLAALFAILIPQFKT